MFNNFLTNWLLLRNAQKNFIFFMQNDYQILSFAINQSRHFGSLGKSYCGDNEKMFF
jgi:hypothetical protein